MNHPRGWKEKPFFILFLHILTASIVSGIRAVYLHRRLLWSPIFIFFIFVSSYWGKTLESLNSICWYKKCFWQLHIWENTFMLKFPSKELIFSINNDHLSIFSFFWEACIFKLTEIKQNPYWSITVIHDPFLLQEKSRIKLNTVSKEIQFIFNQSAGPPSSVQELPLCAVAAASWGRNISSYETNLNTSLQGNFLNVFPPHSHLALQQVLLRALPRINCGQKSDSCCLLWWKKRSSSYRLRVNNKDHTEGEPSSSFPLFSYLYCLSWTKSCTLVAMFFTTIRLISCTSLFFSSGVLIKVAMKKTDLLL